MPARTNDFQKLVRFIENHLADANATVTESKLFTDSVTGELREVDVVIEMQERLRKVVIGIECVDRARRSDVTWVESMHSKHQHIPIDITILVSRSGFNKPALAKAKFLKIRTLTLAESTDPDWIAELRATNIAVFVEEPPKMTKISAYFDPTHAPNETRHVDPVTEIVYGEDRIPIGTMRDIAQYVLENNYQLDLSQYPPELCGFEIKLRIMPEERMWIVGKSGIEVDLIALEAEAIVTIHQDQVVFQPRSYEAANVGVGTGSSPVLGVRFNVVQSLDESKLSGNPAEYHISLPESFRGHEYRVEYRRDL